MLDRWTGPLVVVDNGSDDGTAAALARLDRSDLTLVPLSRNVGAHARDLGVRMARTDLVAFADDDSWWAAGALEEASRAFAKHPRLGLLAGRIEVGPSRRLDAVCEEMCAAPWGQSADLPGPDVLGFLACGAMVRRQAFLDSGGFGRVVPFGGEEERLALDLAARGWGLSYVDAVLARHEPSPTRESPGARSARLGFHHLLTAVQRRPPDVVRDRWRGGHHPPYGRWEAAWRLALAVTRRRRLPDAVERRARQADALWAAERTD